MHKAHEGLAPPEGRAGDSRRIKRPGTGCTFACSEPAHAQRAKLPDRPARRLLHQRIGGRLADVLGHYKDGLRRGRIRVTGGRHSKRLRPERRGPDRRRPGEIGGKWLHGSAIPWNSYRGQTAEGLGLAYNTTGHAPAPTGTPRPHIWGEN